MVSFAVSRTEAAEVLAAAALVDGIEARHERTEGEARKLGCSPAYIHARLKSAGLDLRRVLGEETLSALLIAAQVTNE